MSTEEMYEALQEASIVSRRIKEMIWNLENLNKNLKKQNSELLNHIITDDGASETYYRGYKLSDLFCLAEICRECKISPNELTDDIENIKKIYQRVQDQAWKDFERHINKMFEN